MRAKGRVFQAARENADDSREWQSGTFIPPTLIELDSFDELKKEVFGPVLHVVRYSRNQLDALIGQINDPGYGLTLGVHTRIDETIAQVTGSAGSGQPVREPQYGRCCGWRAAVRRRRSLWYRPESRRPDVPVSSAGKPSGNRTGDHPARQDAGQVVDTQLKTLLEKPLTELQGWLANRPELLTLSKQYSELAQAGTQRVLPGPTGERNTWTLLPRERVLCIADNEMDLLTQLAAVLAVGSEVLWTDAIAA